MNATEASKLFDRLPGTARNYYDTRNPNGGPLSRRQRDAAVDKIVRESGSGAPARKPVSFERLKRQRHQTDRYQDLLHTYVDARRAAGDTVTIKTKSGLKTRLIGPGDLRTSAEFKRLLGELQTKNKNGSPAQRRIKAALIALGRREGIPFAVPPGQSAKWLRKQARLDGAQG